MTQPIPNVACTNPLGQVHIVIFFEGPEFALRQFWMVPNGPIDDIRQFTQSYPPGD